MFSTDWTTPDLSSMTPKHRDSILEKIFLAGMYLLSGQSREILFMFPSDTEAEETSLALIQLMNLNAQHFEGMTLKLSWSNDLDGLDLGSLVTLSVSISAFSDRSDLYRMENSEIH